MNKEFKHIDRYSEFSNLYSPSEKDENFIFDECFKTRGFNGTRTKEIYGYKDDETKGTLKYNTEFIKNLYYNIGDVDFTIARDSEAIPKERLIKLLQQRAIWSATLQCYKDKFLKEANEDEKLELIFPENKDTFLPKNITGMLKFYHGRVKEIGEPENVELGKPLKNGKYKTKDGMVYTTSELEGEESAEFYMKCAAKGEVSKEGKTEKEIEEEIQKIVSKRGQILEFDINEDELDKCYGIYHSNGHVPFIFQEEIYQMSKEGNIKWLIESDEYFNSKGRREAIDISNFADFVDWRDSRVIECLEKNGLQLPNGEQSYDEYMQYLENAKEKQNETIEISKNIAINFAKKKEEKDNVVKKKADAQKAISGIEQQLSKENKNVENEK